MQVHHASTPAYRVRYARYLRTTSPSLILFSAVNHSSRRTLMKRSHLLIAVIFISAAAYAADQYAVTYERNVLVKTRDGVILRADIYRPTTDGKFPVLLQRTPYNKDNEVDFGLKAAEHGF